MLKKVNILMPLIGITLNSLLGCSNYASPINQSADQIGNYVEAKRQFTNAVGDALAIKENKNYALIPVLGPAYKVGAVLDPNNPLDLISRDCSVTNDKDQSSEPWAGFPSWSFNRNIDLSAGLPPNIAKTLADIGISFTNAKNGSFALTDLSQKLLSRDELGTLLSEEKCAKATSGRDVVLVRGVIYGKEKLDSTEKLAASAKVTLKKFDSNVFQVSYDDAGGFSITDQNIAPKLLVVSYLQGTARNATIEESLKIPSGDFIKKAEESSFKASSQ